MAEVQISGTEKMQALGRDLRRVGGPTARGLRSGVRRSIVASVAPMKREVQSAATGIPAHGPKSTGLRSALSRAVTLRIGTSTRNAVVTLFVDPGKMRGYPASIPSYMEGTLAPWRHPVYGDTDKWTAQSSHPFFFSTVNRRLPAVRAAVVATVDQTIAQIERGV